MEFFLNIKITGEVTRQRRERECKYLKLDLHERTAKQRKQGEQDKHSGSVFCPERKSACKYVCDCLIDLGLSIKPFRCAEKKCLVINKSIRQRIHQYMLITTGLYRFRMFLPRLTCLTVSRLSLPWKIHVSSFLQRKLTFFICLSFHRKRKWRQLRKLWWALLQTKIKLMTTCKRSW